MPPRRTGPVHDPITIHVDREAVTAKRGEPLAIALAASGRLLLGRSIKYHRPRGAVCYSGRCDGCLMRVDGRPNVVTCREAARPGMQLSTQNVVGTAKTDLLAATDWFFPAGMDHHQMFTQIRAANEIMQKVARRVAGIGKLPAEVAPVRDVGTVESDVLVIGGGPAGLSFAAAAAKRGARVVVVDEGKRVGGHLRTFPGRVPAVDGTDAEVAAQAVADALEERALTAGATLLTDHTATGVYDAFVLLDSEHGAKQAQSRVIVTATGNHEGSLAIEGSDRPGVISVRGACTLLAHGVVPGDRVAVVGSGPWVDALVHALRANGAHVLGPYDPRQVARLRGRPSVEAIELTDGGKTERVACDAAVLAGTVSAAYELGAQAGAEVAWMNDAFRLVASQTDGATRAAHVRAIGECAGIDSLRAITAQAERAAQSVCEELSRV